MKSIVEKCVSIVWRINFEYEWNTCARKGIAHKFDWFFSIRSVQTQTTCLNLSLASDLTLSIYNNRPITIYIWRGAWASGLLQMPYTEQSALFLLYYMEAIVEKKTCNTRITVRKTLHNLSLRWVYLANRRHDKQMKIESICMLVSCAAWDANWWTLYIYIYRSSSVHFSLQGTTLNNANYLIIWWHARCSLPVCYKCVLYIVLIFLRDFQLGFIREECNLWLQFKRRVVYAMMHMHRKYVWDRIVLNRKSNASRGECRYQCINGRLTVHIHTHLSSFSFCPSPPYALEFFIDLSIISFWPDVQRTLTCDHGEWERNEHHHNCVVY